MKTQQQHFTSTTGQRANENILGRCFRSSTFCLRVVDFHLSPRSTNAPEMFLFHIGGWIGRSPGQTQGPDRTTTDRKQLLTLPSYGIWPFRNELCTLKVNSLHLPMSCHFRFAFRYVRGSPKALRSNSWSLTLLPKFRLPYSMMHSFKHVWLSQAISYHSLAHHLKSGLVFATIRRFVFQITTTIGQSDGSFLPYIKFILRPQFNITCSKLATEFCSLYSVITKLSTEFGSQWYLVLITTTTVCSFYLCQQTGLLSVS